VDPFDDLLRGVRADGAVFGRSVLSPPWALTFDGGACLTLCAPVRGEGWILKGTGEKPRLIRQGEVAIVSGSEPFVVADEPAPASRSVKLGNARCINTEGDEALPVDLPGQTVLMVGTYDVKGEVPLRLLRVLPPVVVVPAIHAYAPLREYLEDQLAVGPPGRQIVLDRLLDWLLVCTLREWFDHHAANPPAWYLALGDCVVGPVLRAMHEAPGKPWTLASLAAEAGISRTVLAKRFTELLGEPPLTYLTEWRMALAADMLAESRATVAEVAKRVGYADAFSFSAAFKRVRGVSPSGYRSATSQS
jgi:AraC-like DNA-binding protein